MFILVIRGYARIHDKENCKNTGPEYGKLESYFALNRTFQ